MCFQTFFNELHEETKKAAFEQPLPKKMNVRFFSQVWTSLSPNRTHPERKLFVNFMRTTKGFLNAPANPLLTWAVTAPIIQIQLLFGRENNP